MNGFLRVFFYITGGVLLFFANFLYAQDGNIVYVQTWDFEMPDDGSWSEFDSLSTLVNKKVVSKNPKILTQRIIRHQWGSDSGQLIVIREFSKIEDLVVDDNSGNELFKAAWNTEEERKEFSKAYGKYWQGRHSDEIYQEFAGARK